MLRPTNIALSISFILYSMNAIAIDKETAVLLKKLTKQVEELQSKSVDLQSKSDASDAKIQALDQKLQQEKIKNQQLIANTRTTNTLADISSDSSASSKINAKTLDNNEAPDSRPPVTLGDVKGTYKIPGTDTSIGLGGYVKLDITESSAGMGGGDNAMQFQNIPVGARNLGPNSQLGFNARETRIWLKSFTPSNYGDINTYVEVDWYGSLTSYAPNLRHAYGSFGNFTVGQTWTTFINDNALPDTLDFTGPVGTLKVRHPLVRWTQPFKVAGQAFDLMTSVEAPNSLIANAASPATIVAPGANRYPDVVGRLNYKADWGELSLAGMARDIRYYGTLGLTTITRNQMGGAVSLAGKINLFSLDDIRFFLNYGNALSGYLTYTGNSSTNSPFADGILDANNNLHLINAYSAMLAYQHWWNDKWRSNFAYGFERADLPLSLPQTALLTQVLESVHANLLWNPLPAATLGIEYIYGSRALIDGGNGNLSRAQFSAKYSF